MKRISAALGAVAAALDRAPGGRIMALDVGASKCGVAVSDPGNMVAFPIHQYRRQRAVGQDVAMLRQLMAQHSAVALAVGLPLDLEGTEGAAVAAVRSYAAQLSDDKNNGGLGLESSAVVFWDERFTSRLITKRTVQERGRRPGAIKRDSGAAALMLQEILDGLRQQQNR